MVNPDGAAGRGVPKGFTASARHMGIIAGGAVVVLELLYVGALSAGLATLPTPDDPISDPWFTLMELLILALVPAFVVLMVAVEAYAAREDKVYARAAVVFMAMMGVVTACVHFSILTLSWQLAFEGYEHVFAFRWPSVVYALDILAWDVFFALSVLCAAMVFRGAGLERAIRWLLLASGGLALAGLIGVPAGDMMLRNIGILGYVGTMTPAAGLMAWLWIRTPPIR